MKLITLFIKFNFYLSNQMIMDKQDEKQLQSPKHLQTFTKSNHKINKALEIEVEKDLRFNPIHNYDQIPLEILKSVTFDLFSCPLNKKTIKKLIIVKDSSTNKLEVKSFGMFEKW